MGLPEKLAPEQRLEGGEGSSKQEVKNLMEIDVKTLICT